jgi:hypothetical protein
MVDFFGTLISMFADKNDHLQEQIKIHLQK